MDISKSFSKLRAALGVPQSFATAPTAVESYIILYKWLGLLWTPIEESEPISDMSVMTPAGCPNSNGGNIVIPQVFHLSFPHCLQSELESEMDSIYLQTLQFSITWRSGSVAALRRCRARSAQLLGPQEDWLRYRCLCMAVPWVFDKDVSPCFTCGGHDFFVECQDGSPLHANLPSFRQTPNGQTSEG